ncbi:MAG: LysM peptidoglycan-binding domain-containing protein [Lentimicrobiaceae bacterium]|nr:LysM peptidoglycan-binding domain-containing protein [Lentimicrobiaceae bacterium]
MKKTIFFLFIALMPFCTMAQKKTEVKRSEIIEKIEGKDYYIHFVKDGQTIEAIAKAYEVNTTTLTEQNPELTKGIRAKQIIKIPVVLKTIPVVGDKEKNTTNDKQEIADKVTDNFIYHAVQEKETFYSITTKYGVTERELMDNNPELNNGLKMDAIIKIPVKNPVAKQEPKKTPPSGNVQKNTVEPPKSNNAEYIQYPVAEKETLWAISKKFGVSIEEITASNPELKTGLKKGQIINIPSHNTANKNKVQEPVQPRTIKEVKNKEIEQKQIVEPEKKVTNANCNESGEEGVYRVALMLPLYLKDVDNINVATIENVKDATSFKSMRFLQFYEGAVIAADSLKSKGLKVKMYVYDIDEDTSRTGVLLRKPEMKQMDMIIGPFYSRNFKKVSAFAKKNGIPVINPLSQRSEIVENNHSVYKIQPSVNTGFDLMARYIMKNYSNPNVIVIRYPNTNETAALLSALKAEMGNGKTGKILFKECISISEIIKNLSPDRENIILALSENKAFVFNILNKLNEQRNNHRITLFGMPSWAEMDFDIVHALNLNLHLYQPSFVDFKDAHVNTFIGQFRTKYKTVPEQSKYAFLGFDVTWYFLNALYRYGKDFGDCLSNMEIRTLETRFGFKSFGNDGYENQLGYIIRYKDYLMENVSPER